MPSERGAAKALTCMEASPRTSVAATTSPSGLTSTRTSVSGGTGTRRPPRSIRPRSSSGASLTSHGPCGRTSGVGAGAAGSSSAVSSRLVGAVLGVEVDVGLEGVLVLALLATEHASPPAVRAAGPPGPRGPRAGLSTGDGPYPRPSRPTGTRSEEQSPVAQSVVVTGANSGIGLVTCLELATAGFDVVGTVRSLAKADALQRAAADRGVAVHALELDVDDAARVRGRGRGGGRADRRRAVGPGQQRRLRPVRRRRGRERRTGACPAGDERAGAGARWPGSSCPACGPAATAGSST